MPPAAPPEEVPSLVDVMDRHSTLDSGAWRTEWSFLDLRYVEENLIDPVPDHGRQQLWMRLPQVEGEEPWRGRCLITYVSDLALLAASLVPHGVMLGAPDIPRATLTHSVHFHADPTPGERRFDRSAVGVGGRWARAVACGDVLARWSAAGHLRPGRADQAAVSPLNPRQLNAIQLNVTQRCQG